MIDKYIYIYIQYIIIVWECTLMCMCMVTLLSMRFYVFICVYMYSCMYLLNCIFIDCLYYWSLLTMYYCFLWICSANFGIKQLELHLRDSCPLTDVNPHFTAPGCRYYLKINSWWPIVTSSTHGPAASYCYELVHRIPWTSIVRYLSWKKRQAPWFQRRSRIFFAIIIYIYIYIYVPTRQLCSWYEIWSNDCFPYGFSYMYVHFL